jgi:hypothetical protein
LPNSASICSFTSRRIRWYSVSFAGMIGLVGVMMGILTGAVVFVKGVLK